MLKKAAMFSRGAPWRAAACCTPSPARANATVSLTTARGLAIFVASAPLPLRALPVFVRPKADAPLRAVVVWPAPPPSAAGTSSNTPATSCAASSAAPPAFPAEGRASACASASAAVRLGKVARVVTVHRAAAASEAPAAPPPAVPRPLENIYIV